MESIQNVVQNAQKIVDTIGKTPHRSSSKELQRSQGRPDYDFRHQNTYLRTGYVNGSQALTSHKGYQTDYAADHSLISAPSRPEAANAADLAPPGDALTNLERYKQKLKTQRVLDPPHTSGPSHRPSLAYKASVRDTVSKLQEQSRLNGSAYGTNQFSSMDVRTRDQDNTAKAGTNDRHGADESDNERLEDDTTSEDRGGAKKAAAKGLSGHGTSQRQGKEQRGGSAKATAEYA